MLRTLAVAVVVPALAVLAWLSAGSQRVRADFVVASGEPRTLDPHRVSWIPEIQVVGALFEGLTRQNPGTFLPEPALAESWSHDPQRQTWTFRLRPDARWSTGAPITADDFRFSWLRVLDPSVTAQYASLLFVIDGGEAYYRSRLNETADDDVPASAVGVDVVDPRTLRVRLATPCPYFLDLTSFPTFAPVHPPTIRRWAYRDGQVLRSTQHLWTRPGNMVTSGAFVLSAWSFRERILLRRNRHYWDPAGVHVDSIEIYMVRDPNAALMAYETGRVDLVRELEPAAARVVLAEQRRGARSDFHVGDRFATFFYRVNCLRPPLDDVDLRRALSLALDRPAICEHVMALGEHPARTFVPPSFSAALRRETAAGGSVTYESPPGLGAGLERAERVTLARAFLDRHLARHGLRRAADVRPIELAFAPTPEQRRVAEAVQQMWVATLGVPISLRVMEGKALSTEIRALNYDLARSNWFGDYMDPSTFLNMFRSGDGQNRTGWSHEGYDALIAAAAREADNAERYRLLARAEQILCEQAPIITVFHRSGNFLLNPAFEGLSDHPRDLLPIHRVRPARLQP